MGEVETTFLNGGDGESIEEKANEVFEAIELVEEKIAINDFSEVEAEVQAVEEEIFKVQDVQEEVRMTDSGEGKRPFFFDPSLFIDEEDSNKKAEVFTGPAEDQNRNDSDETDNSENAMINVKSKLVEVKELKESISQKDSDEKNDNQNIEVKSESLTRNNGRKATAHTFKIVEEKEEITLISQENKVESNSKDKEGSVSDLQNKGEKEMSDNLQVEDEKEEGKFLIQTEKHKSTDIDNSAEVSESDVQNEGRKSSPDIFQTLMALMLKDQ